MTSHLNHPYAGKINASIKARRGRLGAKAGKSWGAGAIYTQGGTKYPKKNAGTSSPMTISGKAGPKRPDRQPNSMGKYARGGGIKGRKPHSVTNIVISHAGGQGGRAGGIGGPGAMPPRPPMAGPPVGGPPPGGPPRPPMPPIQLAMGGPPGMPPGLGGPGAPPGLTPPPPGGIFKRGGVVRRQMGGPAMAPPGNSDGVTCPPDSQGPQPPMAAGGSVKRQLGGVAPLVRRPLAVARPMVRPVVRRPVAIARPPVAAAPIGGLARAAGARAARRVATGFERGGEAEEPGGEEREEKSEERSKTKKRQLGGFNPVSGARPVVPARQLPPVPTVIPQTAMQRRRARFGATTPPAPGTSLGYKKGGSHSDAAEDKKLIHSEFKKLEAKEDKGKRAAGGFVPTKQTSKDPGLIASKYRQQGAGFRQRGGHVGGVGPQSGRGPKMPGSAAGGLGRLAKAKMAAKVPADTEL